MKLSHSHAAKLGALGLLLRLVTWRMMAWFTRRELIVVALLEHMGDIVACEPVVGHLRAQHRRPWLVWVCLPRFAELMRHHPGVDRVATVPCLTSWIIARRYSLAHRQVDLHLNGRACPVCLRALENRINPAITPLNYLDHGSLQRSFALAAGLAMPDTAPRLHFPPDIDARIAALGLPRDFVVVHAKANETARDWLPERWAGLAHRIGAEFGLATVEVGLASVLVRGGGVFVDLCGRLSLLETARVIQRARLFIGVESGPAHLANAVDCPGVVLIGRYRNFASYQPYSGFYAEGGVTFVRSTERLEALGVDEVCAAVAARLALPAAPQSLRS